MESVVFDPAAEEETREAVSYYEEARPGLGQAFLRAIEAASQRIAERPRTWPRLKGKFRRFLIPRFPYGLIYIVEDEGVYI